MFIAASGSNWRPRVGRYRRSASSGAPARSPPSTFAAMCPSPNRLTRRPAETNTASAYSRRGRHPSRSDNGDPGDARPMAGICEANRRLRTGSSLATLRTAPRSSQPCARRIPGRGRGLSQPPGHPRGAVRAGRQHHHRRPHHRRSHGGDARPADHHRQPARRRRNRRHPPGREKCARRLHHRARLHRHAGHRPVAVSQCRLRRAQGFRADRPHRHRAEHARGPSVVPGAFGAGADRLCQGEPRQGQLRLGRRRHRRPCRRRAIGATSRHQAHPHPLQGNRAGHDRPPRRPHPDVVRAGAGGTRERQAAGCCASRGDEHHAFGARAGCADHRRESGLPGYEAVLRYGLAAPAGTPRPIVDRLNKELKAALASKRCATASPIEGAEPLPSTPEEYGADIDREETQWSKVVKASGAKPE